MNFSFFLSTIFGILCLAASKSSSGGQFYVIKTTFLRGRRYHFVIDDVHVYVYGNYMKKRELENALRQLGWKFLRHGRRHDGWAYRDREEAIPRHAEINEIHAQTILRRAKRKN